MNAEIVQAVAEAIWEAVDDKGISGRITRDDADVLSTVAVAAAEPHLTREAKAMALREAELEVRDATSIPINARAAICAVLRGKAHRIEREGQARSAVEWSAGEFVVVVDQIDPDPDITEDRLFAAEALADRILDALAPIVAARIENAVPARLAADQSGVR